MPDDVDVHAQTAYYGLTRWNDTTAHIARLCTEGSARIQRLVAAAPWGDDSAGTAFHAAYTKDAGPEVLQQAGERIAKDVETLGVKVRTAVKNTRGTDKKQAGTTMSI
ncbi:hypothetical protein [Sphaerisporangium perillae]|uniref:hypothetical protein n=1 Tax=Sphaerisporangium perillae TaxID=2935860 RepID=UPI00200D62D3|nr:hypothetical protein [Sphaerisporangium perillae]